MVKCAHCGEARDAKDEEHETVRYAEGSAPATAKAAQDSLRAEERSAQAARLADRRADDAPATRGGGGRAVILWALLIVPALIGAVLLALSLLRTTEEPATVLGTRWERVVQIEEFRTLTQEGWEPPADARVLSSEIRIKRWDDVLVGHETKTRPATRRVKTGTESYGCGTRDLGNGFFEDQTCTRDVYETQTYTETYQDPVYERVPRYDDWDVYEVDRWVAVRVARTSGDDVSPVWPEPALRPRERAGARSGEYVLIHENPAKPGERLSSRMSEAEWAAAARARRVIAKVNYWGFSRLLLT